MANDNKLAHLVAPLLDEVRCLMGVMTPFSERVGEGVQLANLKVRWLEVEQQVQADLIEQPVPDVPAPKDEISVLLDLFQVAAVRQDEHACQFYRREIAKVIRHGVK